MKTHNGNKGTEKKASKHTESPSVRCPHVSHFMLGEHQVVFEGGDGPGLALCQLGLLKNCFVKRRRRLG